MDRKNEDEKQNSRIRPFGWRDEAGYLAGNLAGDLTFTLCSGYLMKFYTDVMGVNAAVIGIMMMLAQILDAFTDFGMGRMADRPFPFAKGRRRGRFLPWIRLAAGPTALTSFLMYAGWIRNAAMPVKIVWMFASYFLYSSVFYTMAIIPYGALAAAMTQDPVERTRLSNLRHVGGTLAMTFINVILPVTVYYENAEGNLIFSGKRMMIAAGCFSFAAFLLYMICIHLSRERYTALPEAEEKKVSDTGYVDFEQTNRERTNRERTNRECTNREHTSRGYASIEHTSIEHTSRERTNREHTNRECTNREHTSRGYASIEHTSRERTYREHVSGRDRIRRIFTSRSLWAILLLIIFQEIANSTFHGMGSYIFPDYFHSAAAMSFASAEETVICLTIAVVIVPIVAKTGKKEITAAGIIVCILALVSGLMLHTHRVWVWLIIYGGISVGLSMINPVAYALVADVSDDLEARTGIRSEGTVYGSYSFCRKLGQSCASAIRGWMLASAGYTLETATDQVVTDRIYDITCMIPLIGFLAMFLVIMFLYPLGKERISENQKKLQKK